MDLEVPLMPEHREIRVGDIAHLVVVSDKPNMTRFQVVREAYIPEARCVGRLAALRRGDGCAKVVMGFWAQSATFALARCTFEFPA